MATGHRIIATHDGGYQFLTDPTHTCLMLPNSDQDCNHEYVALLVDCWVCILADSPLHTEKPSGGKPAKVFRTFHKWLLSRPLKETITDFSSLADALFRSGTLYGEGSTTGTFLPAFKNTPVFHEYLEWFKSGDARILQFLLSFLLFGKKAELSDSSLEPDALRKWLKVEERLNTLVLDQDILSDLKYLLALLLKPLPILPFMGKNGPGTVAGGGRSTSLKMKQVVYDPKVDRAFFLSVGHTVYQERLAHRPEDVVPNYEDWLKARYAHKQSQTRPAELLFVPKTVSSMRSICREPAVLMYFQQALRYELEESISSGPLRRFIDIKDQTYNQNACIAGSAGGLIDTIDLSSASDSVSLDLVKQIFPRHFLIRMLATRSRYVTYDDENEKRTIEVKKFAPMGSAVCFPTQCIIYTVVGLRSMLRWAIGPDWRERIKSRSQFEKVITQISFRNPEFSIDRLQPLRVYGDDILCDSRITEDIIHTLHLLGFEVNVDKSFLGSCAFRESCGVYAWNGEDVSPLRFKVSYFVRDMSIKTAASLVDFANRAGDLGYNHLRRCIIHTVLRHPIRGVTRNDGEVYSTHWLNPIKFTNDTNEFGIFVTSEPRNSHLRHRYYESCADGNSTCVRFQRDEVKCICVQDRFTRDQSSLRMRYEYIRWWRTAYHGADSSDEDRRASWHDRLVRGSSIRWGWTPA